MFYITVKSPDFKRLFVSNRATDINPIPTTGLSTIPLWSFHRDTYTDVMVLIYHAVKARLDSTLVICLSQILLAVLVFMARTLFIAGTTGTTDRNSGLVETLFDSWDTNHQPSGHRLHALGRASRSIQQH